MSGYEPSGVMNDRPRPRIVLWVRSADDADYQWVKERAATFRRIARLDEINLQEWDVLVTNLPFAEITKSQWGLNYSQWGRVPDHLYIFRLFDSIASNEGRTFFEFDIDKDGYANPRKALKLEAGIAGHSMVRASSLPEPIQELVKTDLLEAAENRSKQFGIRKTAEQLAPAVVNLRPFLYGPSNLVLAASYERPGGKSVWLVPSDVYDRAAWFDVAINEWHISDSRTFPDHATWQTDAKWDTAEQRVARAALEEIDATFAAQQAEYELRRAEAVQQVEEASARALNGPKALLTAQDDELQQAVLAALLHLGFSVRDMDKIWNERERREDFRISDPADENWLVLADATGVAKGAPGSKITTVVGYVSKFVLDEKPESVPGVWVIVNRLFHRDPAARGEIFRGDDIAVLKSQNGLAIDTPALYLLSQEIDASTPRAEACRAWLRCRTGQVTTADASEWLSANP